MGNVSLDQNQDFQFNASSNFDCDDYGPSWHSIAQPIIAVVLSIVGVIGNIFMCIVVFRRRNLQTSLNLFLGTLAFADLLYCLGGVIVNPTFIFGDSWMYGEFACYASTFVDEFHELYGSIIASTAIILFLCRKISLKMAYVTIFIVGMCTAIMSFVSVKFTHLHNFDEQQVCLIDWPDHMFNAAHQILKLLVNVVLPVMMIVVSLVLRFILKIEVNASSSRLLTVTMVIYVLLWSPMTVVLTFFHHTYFHTALIVLSHLAAVYKPIVYYKMDHILRAEFLDLFSKCFVTKRPHVYDMQLIA